MARRASSLIAVAGVVAVAISSAVVLVAVPHGTSAQIDPRPAHAEIDGPHA